MEHAPLTIPALLGRAVRESGDRTYLVSPTERLTYAGADRRSAALAGWLLAHGAGKGTRVGLFFANGAEWVIWWLAVSRIGAVAVPLSTLYRPAEIAKVVRLADVAMLVAPERVLDIDVARRLEAAFPDLGGHRRDQAGQQFRDVVAFVVRRDDDRDVRRMDTGGGRTHHLRHPFALRHCGHCASWSTRRISMRSSPVPKVTTTREWVSTAATLGRVVGAARLAGDELT